MKNPPPRRSPRRGRTRSGTQEAAPHGKVTQPRAAAALSSKFSPREVPAILALGLLVGVSYFPALSGGFIWDDVIFTEEPVVHAASGLRNIWLSPADIKSEAHYWPLVYTSFWLEHQLWGLAPAGYHAVNILLHLINCLLLWRLLRRLAVPGALVIAAVFAVHPLHVESVAWIIERKDLLSALCYLSAVLAWIRFTEAPRPGRYVLALALFTAGLLSKSVVVTLPAALLIWHWWQRGRVTPVELLRLAPFLVVGLGITVADLSFYTSREPLELGYSLLERALIAARALWFYAGKLLWPTELAVIYPRWKIDAGDPLAWAYLIAAVALAALLWLGRGRIGRGPLAGALFFAVTLAPVLGFVDYGYMQFSLVADRFQYLAGIGVLAVLIGAAAHAAGTLPGGFRIGACGLAVAVVVLLGVLTWRQAGIYRDELTFFSHIVALNPEARGAHHNLGRVLLNADRPEEALAASRSAVEQRPDFADAHSNLGLVLLDLKRTEAAEEHFLRALELDPRHRDAHHNRANILRTRGHYQEAVDSYRAVLDIDPEYALAHAGMGDALFHLALYAEAIESLTRAVSLQPDLPEAGALHGIMGLAAQELGQSEAAAEYYERAVRIDPHDSVALGRLATLRFRQQRYEEALARYRRLVEIGHADAQTHSNLGVTLYYLDRPEDALRSFERALSLDPSLATARSGLEQMRKALRQQGQEPLSGTGESKE